MKRRDFIAALAGAAAWPAVARAQQAVRVRRIGILVVGAPPPARDLELVRELARLGWVEGRNAAYIVAGEGPDQLPQIARTLLAREPEVIIGAGVPLTDIVIGMTDKIPIVMTATGDPVAIGYTASMARPTRNITGFTISSPSIVAKRLEILRELLPGARKVGHIWAPGTPIARNLDEEARMAATALGLELVSMPLGSGADIPSAFTLADKEHVAAILSDPDMLTVQFSATIADECLVRDLPLIHAWTSQVRNGALLAYGPASVENFKGAAGYVDRILKGAKVADLPFEEPTQLQLAINLRTARSIGLTVPPRVLALADEVIE